MFTAASGSCYVKQLPLIGFDKCVKGKGPSQRVGSESGQVNTSLVSGCFQATVRQVNNDNYLRIVLLESSKLVLSLQWPLGCWFSLWLQAFGFQGYHGAEERGLNGSS